MAKTLVIVESQKKGKTIGKILGDDYKVIACGGHIRDMVKDGSLGFDRNTLSIQYQMSPKNKEWVNNIRQLINMGQIDHVILASDPDREGEAIALALKEEIGLTDSEYERCKFNEITKDAILKAIKGSSGDIELIDQKIVDSQESRRILDRYIGWEGSQNVSAKLLKHTPIGRVQTQALRFIVEREHAIKNFTTQEYYALQFQSKTKAQEAALDFWISKLDVVASGIASSVPHGESNRNVWSDKIGSQKLKQFLESKPDAVCVKNIIEERSSNPPPPFTTTTMQQAAINNLGLSGKQIDKLAQELYQEGFITYPRTDSTRLSDEGFVLIKSWAQTNAYPILESKRMFSKDSDAQDAHECIRPSIFDKEPTELGADHLKLYRLILARAVMSQMPAKRYEHREAHFKINFEGKDYLFKSEGNSTLGAGFTTFYKNNQQVNDNEDEDIDEGVEAALPAFSEGDVITVDSAQVKTEKTKPPTLFTQAKLNRVLDKNGIGRPSTYSTIFEKIIEHNYVMLGKSRKKAPEIRATELGIELVDSIQSVFKIMQPQYTRMMEEKLDEVAAGGASKIEITHQFLNEFDEDIRQMDRNLPTLEKHYCTNENCNGVLHQYVKLKDDGSLYRYYKCQQCYQVHFLKNGSFITPESILRPFLNSDGSPKHPCPECGSALRQLQNKKGGYFWVCSNNSNKNKKKRCEYLIGDYDSQPDFENLARQKFLESRLQKAKEENRVTVCPICSGDLIENKGTGDRGDYHNFKCYDCGLIAYPDNNGIMKTHQITRVLKYSDNQKPKVPCPDCGGVLIITGGSDGKNYTEGVVCSRVFMKNPPCNFKKRSISIEDFEERVRQYDEQNK